MNKTELKSVREKLSEKYLLNSLEIANLDHQVDVLNKSIPLYNGKYNASILFSINCGILNAGFITFNMANPGVMANMPSELFKGLLFGIPVILTPAIINGYRTITGNKKELQKITEAKKPTEILLEVYHKEIAIAQFETKNKIIMSMLKDIDSNLKLLDTLNIDSEINLNDSSQTDDIGSNTEKELDELIIKKELKKYLMQKKEENSFGNNFGFSLANGGMVTLLYNIFAVMCPMYGINYYETPIYFDLKNNLIDIIAMFNVGSLGTILLKSNINKTERKYLEMALKEYQLTHEDLETDIDIDAIKKAYYKELFVTLKEEVKENNSEEKLNSPAKNNELVMDTTYEDSLTKGHVLKKELKKELR